MQRPSIKSPCVADRYVTGCERIAEFSAPNGKGGLIRIMQHKDDRVTVDVYRTDPGVEIRTGQPGAARAMLAALEATRFSLAGFYDASENASNPTMQAAGRALKMARIALNLAKAAGITATEGE